MFWFQKKKKNDPPTLPKGSYVWREVVNPFETGPEARRPEGDPAVEKYCGGVDLVAEKLKEKYAGYRETVEFIEYLRATEILFARSASAGSPFEETKKETIRFDIQNLAEQTKLDPGLFESIYTDFQAAHSTTSAVYSIADSLKEKYADSPDCVALVVYLREVFALFAQSTQDHWELDKVHEHLVRVKMQFLCSNGYPEMSTLEAVYNEFRSMLPHGT